MKNNKSIIRDNIFSGLFWNNSRRNNQYFVLFVCCLFFALEFGCKNFPKFDPTGKCLFENAGTQSCLFGSKTKTAETIADSKEKEIIRNNQNQSSESPWAPTTSNIDSTSNSGTASAVYWNSQRPNGGILFPNSLTKNGPLLVLEPQTTIAQIGEEIVLVGSYVGENNEYLRVNEKIEWGLDGQGRFLTSNPSNLLNCCSIKNDKENERARTTLTSNKLWRIHRGTETRSDDISILKGQTWMSLLSNQEGTSNVSIFAPNIDNWNNRTASAVVHWIDASFSFPSSRISPLGQPQYLTTIVLRKSDLSQGRQNWIVRYEILSGPSAGFGPDMVKICEVLTDANGQAVVALNQQESQMGTNRILIQIFEPATTENPRFLVDQKTISQSWTGSAFFNIQTEGPPQIKLGTNAAYSIYITNTTSLPQNATIRMPIPAGTQFVASSSQPQALIENNNAIWVLNNVPARTTQKIQFELQVNTTDPINVEPRVSQTDNISSTSTIIPTEIPNSTTNPIESLPPNPGKQENPQPPQNNPATDPAAMVPLLNEAKTNDISLPVGEKLAFRFIEPFPKQANKNEQFTVAFQIDNPYQLQLPNVMIRLQIPEGVIYHHSNSGDYDQHIIETSFIPLTQLINKLTPMTFSSSKTGAQTIVLQILDSDKKMLASSTNVTNIIDNPAASQTPDVSSTQPNVSMEMSNESKTAPNFETGQTVPFHFLIKNNGSTPLSDLNFILIQEKSRANLPWKLESSTPPGAQATSLTGEAWQLSIDPIAANGQQEIVMFLTPLNTIASGVMSASLYANNLQNPVAQKDYVYTISAVRNTQRPETDVSKDSKENIDQESESLNKNQTSLNEDDSLNEKNIEPENESESKGELNVNSIMIKPKIANGQPGAILIHQKPNENGIENEDKPAREALKDQPFAYRMELVNQESLPIEAKRLTISMTVSDHLTFASTQPENSFWKESQQEKKKWTFVSQKMIDSQKPHEIVLEFIPVQSGMATLDIEIFDQEKLLSVIQHPISVSE